MKITKMDSQVRIEGEVEGVWCYLDIDCGGQNYYAEMDECVDHDDIAAEEWDLRKTLKIDLTTSFWMAVADTLGCDPTLDALFEYTSRGTKP